MTTGNFLVQRLSDMQAEQVLTLIASLFPEHKWSPEMCSLFIDSVRRYPYDWILDAIEKHRLENEYKNPKAKSILFLLKTRSQDKARTETNGPPKVEMDPNEETYVGGGVKQYQEAKAHIDAHWDNPDWGKVYSIFSTVQMTLIGDRTRVRPLTRTEIMKLVEDRRMSWKEHRKNNPTFKPGQNSEGHGMLASALLGVTKA